MLELDLSEMPREVTDHAFDNFYDRMLDSSHLEAALGQALSNDGVQFDYDTQEITLGGTVITELLKELMLEKLRDIEYELRHHKRDDDVAFAAPDDDRPLEDVKLTRDTLKQMFRELTLVLEAPPVPTEVTDYAFDQFHDRVEDEVLQGEALERIAGDEAVSFDYEPQTAEMDELFIMQFLADAMAEKFRDIEYEVEHGERDDYTESEIRSMKRNGQTIRLLD